MYYLLVMCLSTNGERAQNYTIVKRLILYSNTRYYKKLSVLITYIRKRGFIATVTTPRNCLNLKNNRAMKKKAHYLIFFCDKHNTFTQLNMPTQDLHTLVSGLVVNEFSSKYCCVGLTMTNSVLTYHRIEMELW